MKAMRWALVITMSLVILLGGLALLVENLAVPLADQPLPDPGQVITMPNGESRTLADLLASSRLPPPADESAEEVSVSVTVDGEQADFQGVHAPSAQELIAMSPDELLERVQRWQENRWEGREPDGSDLFQLAEYELDTGKVEQALALYRSVPPDHPQYERAQRRIGWDIYTKRLDDPRRGIAFVQASMNHDPTNGNAWQDLLRVYGNTLGIPID